MSIRKYAGSAARFFVICFVLAKQLLPNFRYRQVFAQRAERDKDIRRYLKTRRSETNGAQIARRTLEQLGPTFIKFGQFLSIRPDLVAPEFCEEFRKLQDNVPPFPFVDAHRQIALELGADPEEIFSELHETPVAAASVAQVQRGRLVSGEEVAVKIQRPGVRRRMEEDILIMLFFAHLLGKLAPTLRKNQLVMLVHEFSRWTDRELDFTREAKNAMHFAHCFAKYPGVKIPRVYLTLTTERLLVMEFVHGVSALELPIGSADRIAVARLIADSMLKQIFLDGFFHGDPHLGNILFTRERTVAYLDFGIVGYLTRDLREWAFDILYGMTRGDVDRVIESFLELCDADPDAVDITSYRRQMNEVLAELHVCEVSGVPFTHMMQDFLNTSLEFGLNVPHDFVLMSKAVATLEGTCLSLDPDLKLVDYLEPFVNKYVVTVQSVEALLEHLRTGPFEIRRLKRLLAKYGERALRMVARPTFRIEGGEFRNLVRESEKSSVNIAYGLLIAALVVFSATVSNESRFERWLRGIFHLPVVPFLSLASLTLAGYLWIRLYLRNRIRRQK